MYCQNVIANKKCVSVTGKNKIWLHVESVSFTLTFAFHCFCSVLSIAIDIHNGLPWGTLPLCLNVKLKCLYLAHSETPWPYPPVNGCRKEEMNTSPPGGWAKPGDILQDVWPFYFNSSPPPPLCSIKETSIQTPIRWHSRMLVCHLLRCLVSE